MTAAVAVSVLLPVRPAFAATGVAREREARKACLTGDYAKGVSILAELFVDTEDPTFIFNQGRCFEQNLKYQDAIARFEEYLRAGGSALRREDRKAAKTHIATCREALAEERASLSAAPTPQPVAPPSLPPAPPAPTPEPSRSILVEPQPQPPVTHGRPGLRTAGTVTAAVGVAAVVVAVVLNVKANSMVNEMETTDNGYSSAKENDRKTYETFSWVSYGMGAACVATGAVLFGMGLRSGGSSPTGVALVPAAGPGQAGALLTGGF